MFLIYSKSPQGCSMPIRFSIFMCLLNFKLMTPFKYLTAIGHTRQDNMTLVKCHENLPKNSQKQSNLNELWWNLWHLKPDKRIRIKAYSYSCCFKHSQWCQIFYSVTLWVLDQLQKPQGYLAHKQYRNYASSYTVHAHRHVLLLCTRK